MAAAPSNKADDDTIFALSSGRPPAAIAVVRISGPRAGAVLEALAGRRPAPRRASLVTLRDAAGDTLDHALTLWFPGPATATGEDLAELHLHGGVAVVDAVLTALSAYGLRLAEPGEFTRRALFNGRLDLTEVQGLADLLAAETETQRREALRRAEGALGRKLRGWADRILAVAAMIEAAIDYDGEVEADGGAIGVAISVLTADIDAALAVPPAERLRDGVRVVIAGPVNAGKSSLFNAIVGSAAAIVSPAAGTTRDLIERPIAIGGVPLVLVDTAGLREADDAIEQEGIARARSAADRADLILDLSPGASPSSTRIAISNKIDLQPAAEGTIGVSAISGEGLPALVATVIERAMALLPGPSEVGLDRRHREAIREARDALALAAREEDMVLAAEQIRAARIAVDRLIGGAGIEDMLDSLFSGFCLGK